MSLSTIVSARAHLPLFRFPSTTSSTSEFRYLSQTMARLNSASTAASSPRNRMNLALLARKRRTTSRSRVSACPTCSARSTAWARWSPRSPADGSCSSARRPRSSPSRPRAHLQEKPTDSAPLRRGRRSAATPPPPPGRVAPVEPPKLERVLPSEEARRRAAEVEKEPSGELTPTVSEHWGFWFRSRDGPSRFRSPPPPASRFRLRRRRRADRPRRSSRRMVPPPNPFPPRLPRLAGGAHEDVVRIRRRPRPRRRAR